ncbi:lysophospholipid acyltransferase family protein [Mycobacterium sp. 23]|uniref:lysophospholipid acyltransferase family protein n=1 Tax=Mycobacterium sp. 23 TaxID=3400424 RepID=UPI003AB0E21F
MTPKSDSGRPAAVEQFADSLLDAVEQVVDPGGARLDAALNALRRNVIEFVRRYHRLEVEVEADTLDDPVLFVANHGFGGVVDLNVMAVSAALEDLELERPVIFLTHQLAWTVGVGPIVEHLGARPASRESAHEAFADGQHVVVFPGGDLDAAKKFTDRNQIVFGGRSGFAQLAMDEGVPIVPIVTAGAGESLLVLSDGERLARALRLDKLLRVKALPTSLSLPWGLNTGAVGMLPYLPLPTKLQTRVLPAMVAEPDEDAQAYAERIHTAMQDALTEMTTGRRPVIG